MITQRHNPAYRPAYFLINADHVCIFSYVRNLDGKLDNMQKKGFTKSTVKRIKVLFLFLTCLVVLAGCGPSEKKVEDSSVEEAVPIEDAVPIKEAETESPWDYEQIDQIRNSTVYLYGQVPGFRTSCTGVIWEMDNALQILTVGHLLDHAEIETIQVTFWDGTYVETGTFQTLKDMDICLLTCDLTEISEETKAGFKTVERSLSAYVALQQNDPVFLLGATPTGRTEMVGGKVGNPDWYVPEFDQNMLYLYVEAKSGMSGAGAFDKNGQYLGMLIGGSENECACLPLQKIEEALLTFTEK